MTFVQDEFNGPNLLAGIGPTERLEQGQHDDVGALLWQNFIFITRQ